MIQKFTDTYLKEAYNKYILIPDARSRFQSTQHIYQAAVQSGLILAQIPTRDGGTNEGLKYGMIMVEEMYAVDPSVTLTILGTGLGLSPIILFGNASQKKKFLAPFLSKEGTPLASFVSSEVGGSANSLDPSPTARGVQTFIEKDGDNHWILNGEKIWATNTGGWTSRGPQLMCVVCRTKNNSTPLSSISMVIVTQSDIEANPTDAFTVVDDFEMIGHHATSGPRIKFTNLRIPAENMLCEPGSGAQATDMVFTGSACYVAAFSIGIMRTAFEKALAFAKSETRNGSQTIIHYQSVSDLLLSMKTKLETSRGLVSRAVESLESQGLGELAYLAKIYCSESAVQVVADAMKVVGVDSYRADFGF
jgi:alkylation response protein AidB-like acyl-CoA dehydrogenase